jgi:hypothetical protein
MATKKQKAELAIQFPEVRSWVLNHFYNRIEGTCPYKPTDLYFNPPPTSILDKSFGEEIYKWLNSPKHLYNTNGAIALMKALLDRVS